jgi:hypothetical protein
MSKTTPLSLGAVEEAPGLSGAKSRGVYVDMVERSLRIQAVAYRDVAAVLDWSGLEMYQGNYVLRLYACKS